MKKLFLLLLVFFISTVVSSDESTAPFSVDLNAEPETIKSAVLMYLEPLDKHEHGYEDILNYVGNIYSFLFEQGKAANERIDAFLQNTDKTITQQKFNDAVITIQNIDFIRAVLGDMLLLTELKSVWGKNQELMTAMSVVQENVELLESYNSQINESVQSALSASDTAFGSLSSLEEVMLGYRQLITDQQELIAELSERSRTSSFSDFGLGRFSFSILGGPVWNPAVHDDISNPGWTAGFDVSFAITRHLGIGVGAMTLIPYGGNQVFGRITFSTTGLAKELTN